MFKDLSTMSTSDLRDKKYAYDGFFVAMRIVGYIVACMLFITFCFALPNIGFPITIILIISGIIFAFLRKKAIEKELNKR